MCSSTRGPASAPSFVTWPTSTIVVPVLLASACQLRRAFAHLGDRAGRRRQRVAVDGLDRIDHADRRLLGVYRRDDLLELDLGQHAHSAFAQTKPARAHRHLRAAFLAGDVERRHLRATAHRAPAAAASTCRCPGRRRSARRRRRRCRRRARGRALRGRSAGARRRWPRSRPRSQPPGCDQAAGLVAVLRRRPRRPLRPACSRRRSPGICRAISGCSRRTRCRCRSTCLWPCARLSVQACSVSAAPPLAMAAPRTGRSGTRRRISPVANRGASHVLQTTPSHPRLFSCTSPSGSPSSLPPGPSACRRAPARSRR